MQDTVESGSEDPYTAVKKVGAQEIPVLKCLKIPSPSSHISSINYCSTFPCLLLSALLPTDLEQRGKKRCLIC